MTRPGIGELRSIVGPANVLVEPDMTAGFLVDWTGRYSGPALAVVRPGSTAEVSAVLRYCDSERINVVPQGGNTGLVGGGVPRVDPGGRETIVLSTRRLGELGPVDIGAQQVTVGAGVTLAEWRDHARRAGLDAPVDFAARDSATIGGAIATNAGGSRVVRFGTMRGQVAGVEAVLADGRVVGSLGGLPKEAAGIHWPSLLAGSEGTMAVVTRARLKLVAHYAMTATAMVSTASVDDAVTLLARLRAGVASLDSVELLMPAALELVAAHLDARPPVSADGWADGPEDGCVVLVECAAHDDPSDGLLAVLDASPEVLDSALTGDGIRRAHLLQFRDRMTEAIAAAAAARGGTPFKLDVAVPVASLGRLLDVAASAARADGAELLAFGHLAEGNLHLNHLGAGDPGRITETVLAAVAAMGGTISAEHGIGVAKARWMPLIRTAGDLAAQRALARALDPHRILNPGVLLPDETIAPGGLAGEGSSGGQVP